MPVVILCHVDTAITSIFQFSSTCCAPMSRLTMRQPTLNFAIHLHGRLVVLAPFPYLFGSLRQPGSAPASLVSGQDRKGLLFCMLLCHNNFFLRFMCRSRCSCSRSRAHCSRSSSTETGSCCSRCYRDGSHAPAGTVQPPYHSKELNLTSDGYSDSLAPFGRWHGFRVL